MPRKMFVLTALVKDGERAFLTRRGRFKKVLEPGRYWWFDPRRKVNAEVFGTIRAEFPAGRYKMLKATHPDVATRLFAVVETGLAEIAIVNFDGRPAHLFGPSSLRVFWKVTTSVDIERIDLAVDPKITAAHFRMLWRLKELESIERLIAKVGPDLLSGNGDGLNALLTGVARLTGKAAPPLLIAAGGGAHDGGSPD
jgi:hypothetical protein